MPPWKPVPGFGDFHGSRRMTDAEIAIIERWVTSGMAEGGAGATAGWPRSRRLGGRSTGSDRRTSRLHLARRRPGRVPQFRGACSGATARFVRGMQFRPRNRAVHHANIRVDATPASRQLDEADPSPGYEGVIARSADFPDGHFLGWTPGQLAPRADRRVVALARRLRSRRAVAPAPHRATEHDRAGRSASTLAIAAPAIDAGDDPAWPPGSRHSAPAPLRMRSPIHSCCRSPRARSRSSRTRTTARDRSRPGPTLPDGSRRAADAHRRLGHQLAGSLRLRDAGRLPAGTRLTSTYVFDNSIGNPRNPDRPPMRARWGWRSTDEMADVWIQVTHRIRGAIARACDARSRRRCWRRMRSAAKCCSSASPITSTCGTTPRRSTSRSASQHAPCAHFERVRTLQPGIGGGVVQRRHRARGAWPFTPMRPRAIRRRFGSTRATRRRSTTPARCCCAPARSPRRGAAFERAVAADPAQRRRAREPWLDADRRRANRTTGWRMSAARIALKPALLAGHDRPRLAAGGPRRSLRRAGPPKRSRSLQQIARVSRDRADALDALAASQAAPATSIAPYRPRARPCRPRPPDRPELRDAIRDRIALYRSRRPFVLPR